MPHSFQKIYAIFFAQVVDSKDLRWGRGATRQASRLLRLIPFLLRILYRSSSEGEHGHYTGAAFGCASEFRHDGV